MPAAPVANLFVATDPLRGAVEVLADRLYYVPLKSHPHKSSGGAEIISKRRKVHFFCIDDELVYWNFFLDFGPLNLGQLYRFCSKLNDKLQSTELSNHVICFYSSASSAKRANAVYLMCAWQVLYLGRSPEEAFFGFNAPSSSRSNSGYFGMSNETSNNESEDEQQQQKPPSYNCSMPPKTNSIFARLSALPPFHDASPCKCHFDLTILDCLRGLLKAKKFGFFDFRGFNVEEYEHFEQVENGDLNWIVKDKILAFAGPHFENEVSPEGYCSLTPSHYIPYFKIRGVGMVVRLNKRCYEEKDFTRVGINFQEHYYPDGSCPPMKILHRVVKAIESSIGEGRGVAVHCKAGLGRTGTCIGAYLMKHYKFTAPEVIGWMRICRPGMVIGPQQQFLVDLQARMWHEGDVMHMKPERHLAIMPQSSPRELKGKSLSSPNLSPASNTTSTTTASTPDHNSSNPASNNNKSNNNTSSTYTGSLHFGSYHQTPMFMMKQNASSSPMRNNDPEATHGRRGQAEGLLAARRRNNDQQHTSSSKRPASYSSRR